MEARWAHTSMILQHGIPSRGMQGATIKHRIRLVGALSSWMGQRGFNVKDLNEEITADFLDQKWSRHPLFGAAMRNVSTTLRHPFGEFSVAPFLKTPRSVSGSRYAPRCGGYAPRLPGLLPLYWKPLTMPHLPAQQYRDHPWED